MLAPVAQTGSLRRVQVRTIRGRGAAKLRYPQQLPVESSTPLRDCQQQRASDATATTTATTASTITTITVVLPELQVDQLHASEAVQMEIEQELLVSHGSHAQRDHNRHVCAHAAQRGLQVFVQVYQIRGVHHAVDHV